MPKVEEALDLVDTSKAPGLRQLILGYLENHHDEVYRPLDKEELARKIGRARPGAIPGALNRLAWDGKISSLWIKGHHFYGSYEAIESLKLKLKERGWDLESRW